MEIGNVGAISTFVSKAEGVLESYNPAAAAANGKASSSSTSANNATSSSKSSGADAIGALFRAGGSSSSTAPNLAGPTVTAGGSVPKTAEARGKKEVADIKARLQVAGALAALGQEKYATAANAFLNCDLSNSSAYSHVSI